MNIQKKKAVEILNRLIVEANEVYGKDLSSREYIIWKNSINSAIKKIFPLDSIKIHEILRINFNSNVIHDAYGNNNGNIIVVAFNNGVKQATALLESYIREINEYWEDDEVVISSGNEKINSLNIKSKDIGNIKKNKVFISHSTKDKYFVGHLVRLLEDIGLNEKHIFCSSLDPYSIPLGSDFLEHIKSEISNDTIVIFVLSENFYQSPVCLCEMGAAWVKTDKNIPLIIPPFTFNDIKGVFKDNQGMLINDKSKLNTLHDELVNLLGIKEKRFTLWETRRDQFIIEVEKGIDNNNFVSDETAITKSDEIIILRGRVTKLHLTNKKSSKDKYIYNATIDNVHDINIYSYAKINSIIVGETTIEAKVFKLNGNVDYENSVEIIS